MVLFTKQHSTFMSSETISENKLASIASIKAGNDVDLVRSYLRDIGRVPLLSHEQEITLGRQVQEYMQVERAELEIIELTGDKPNIDELSTKLNLCQLLRLLKDLGLATKRKGISLASSKHLKELLLLPL